MFSPINKTYLGFGLITGVLLYFNYSGFDFLASYHHDWNDILIIIMAGQNVVTAALIYHKSKENESLFPIYVIVAFIFRLLMAMVIMALAWTFEVGHIETLAINLIALYLIFLTFELYSLLTNLRPNSE